MMIIITLISIKKYQFQSWTFFRGQAYARSTYV